MCYHYKMTPNEVSDLYWSQFRDLYNRIEHHRQMEAESLAVALRSTGTHWNG